MPRKPPAKASDLDEALKGAYPDGILEIATTIEDSHLADLVPKLRDALSDIPGATILHEQQPQDEPYPDPAFEGDDDPPMVGEQSRSYHQFFVAFRDTQFEYDAENLAPDEEGVERKVRGKGNWGCAVGVSLVASVAVVAFDSVETFEDGSVIQPDVHPRRFDMDLKPLDMDEHVREAMGNDGLAGLPDLRYRIVVVLDALGVSVLSEGDAGKPVAWLRPGEGTLTDGVVTVRDALFLRSL
jgi:hypothetical protein